MFVQQKLQMPSTLWRFLLLHIEITSIVSTTW